MSRDVLVSFLLAVLLVIATTRTELSGGIALAFYIGHLFKTIESWLYYKKTSVRDSGLGWEKGTIDKWTSWRRRGK